MPTIYGFLERITYYNEENDFVIAKLQEKGKRYEHQAIVIRYCTSSQDLRNGCYGKENLKTYPRC
jgi:hypothetical protein